MNLVKKSPAPHCHLAAQKLVAEDGMYGAAKLQVLLNLAELPPRHIMLVGEDIAFK